MMSDQAVQRRRRYYLAGAGALLALYTISAVVLALTQDFSDDGPLAFHEPALAAPLAGSLPLDEIVGHCFPDGPNGSQTKLVGGAVDDRPVYACYDLNDQGVLLRVHVVDGDGTRVRDVGLLKRSGVWPWYGVVKTRGELALGALGLLALLWWGWTYYAGARPDPPANEPWWRSRGALAFMAAIPIVGWIALGFLPGLEGRRRRVLLQTAFGWSALLLLVLTTLVADRPDAWGATVTSLLWSGLLFAWQGGRRLVAEESLAGETTPAAATAATEGTALPSPPIPGVPDAAPSAGSQRVSRAPVGSATPTGDLTSSGPRVLAPDRLPSFADVGGMDTLKQELHDTIGLMLAYAGEVETFGIEWNGLLLHGPPGVGKSFIARATAGEFGLHFVPVTTGDLASPYAGESARNIRRAFATAAANVPCLLFFDEFDSVAVSRQDQPDQESRRTVNELLQSLVEHRDIEGLVVMAATNHLDQLDTAAVRPGRFDRHVRIDLPDQAARIAILHAQLDDRPTTEGIEVDDLATRMEGMTPAAIVQVVTAAALAAFRETAAAGELVPIDTNHLLGALRGRGGRDRPTVENWSWERLVLADDVKRELQQIERLLEEPDRARSFGVKQPSGLLLAGPPGTGKTTVARILAAQADCSFYPITAADVTSKWVGESEQRIQRLFARARENAPSIVFIDEIDAIAGQRDAGGYDDRQVTQLLAEIDGLSGQRGVFVVGATNRPDVLDPALLRGGRLSRTIWIPLPDEPDRRRLLELFARDMPLADVDLGALARDSDGLSGADLEALCQQAAVHAMTHEDGSGHPVVTGDDFRAALRTVRESREMVDRDGLTPELERLRDALLHDLEA